MRVDFMNPVQQVMASASHFGTAIYAKGKAEEHESEEKKYRERRFGLEERKLAQRADYLKAYEQQVVNQGIKAETDRYRAETERVSTYDKLGLTPTGRKRKNAGQSYAQVQQTGSNVRKAPETMRRFASGEIDLSSLANGGMTDGR